MDKKYFFFALLLAKQILLLLLFTLLIFPFCIYAQQEKQKLTYHRIDNAYLENYNPNDKEKYFPLNFFNRGTGIWTELNPNVPRVDYIGVDFLNPDIGWACGLWGAVIKTTNAGQDWTIAETPTGEILLKVHSYNGQVVMVVGHNGTILRSSDGGESFILLTGITTQELWGVRMLNDTLGWICGRNQTLLKTTNAGLTWLPVMTGFNYHYWSFDFLTDDYFMIACSQGKVLKTTNGGQNFTQYQAGNTDDLYTIDIIDSLHIAAAGYFGKNVYSSDGGNSWTAHQYSASSMNWVQYINRDTGFVAIETYQGFHKTTNRGQSWFYPGFNETGEWQFELLDEIIGYGVGAGLKVTKTEDGYLTGSKLFLNVDWSDVHFVNETKGLLIGADLGVGIYKTEDGGISYQKIENTPDGYDLFFLDTLTGFIAGTHKTTDGGENWYSVNGGGTKIFFINDSIGWSIGGSNIYKTTDEGENWFTQLNAVDNFTSIFFIDTSNGWASSRYVYQTTDGGLSWLQRMDIPALLSTDIYFVNLDTGWTIDNYSWPELYKTIDSGLNWNIIPEVEGARKFYFFPDPIHWIINGFSNRFMTKDGGNNWIEITNDVPSGFNSFYAVTNNLGYAVGDLGLILRYEDTIYVPVELTSFVGRFEDGNVILEWLTASEINNKGFEIERREDKGKNWISIGFIQGNGTTTEEHSYSYKDITNNVGYLYYRLKQFDYNGNYDHSKIIEIKVGPPSGYKLLQNYPNPFNNSTRISFQIPADGFVTLKVYDILGNEVETLIDENKKAGYHIITYSVDNLSSGIYFYNLTANEHSLTRKFILLK